MNAPFVLSRVKRSTPGSTVGRVLAATADAGEIADQLYLATLSRKPTAIERQAAIDDGQRQETGFALAAALAVEQMLGDRVLDQALDRAL